MKMKEIGRAALLVIIAFGFSPAVSPASQAAAAGAAAAPAEAHSLGGKAVPEASLPGTAPAGAAVREITPSQRAERLEASAEALYGYALEGNLIKARAEAETVSGLFLASAFEGITTVEGVGALSGAITDLKAALAGVQPEPQNWKAAAGRLRLAANSAAHPDRPMWMQYYKLFREDLRRMERSASAGDAAEWAAALSRLQERYDNIRPAVVVSRKPEVVRMLDAWLSHAAGAVQQSPAPGRRQLLDIAAYGEDAVRRLFGKEKGEPALALPLAPPGLGLWGLAGAGFITLALSYAAFRKYRGEREDWKPV